MQNAKADYSVSQYSLFPQATLSFILVRLSVVHFRAALNELRAQILSLTTENLDTRFTRTHL